MSHAYPLAPRDYERMFRTIHGHLRNHFANPHKCCSFFSVIGATILNVAHNIEAISVSGAAVFEIGLSQPIFLSNGTGEFFAHSSDGFHSWIAIDGWIIDLAAPLLTEYAKEANLGVPPRRMLQRPMTDEARSISDLSQDRPFYLLADKEFSAERIDFVFENPTNFKIVEDCIRSYRIGESPVLSELRVEGAW